MPYVDDSKVKRDSGHREHTWRKSNTLPGGHPGSLFERSPQNMDKVNRPLTVSVGCVVLRGPAVKLTHSIKVSVLRAFWNHQTRYTCVE